jgi:uncharacterized damage-inducible protein DinB
MDLDELLAAWSGNCLANRELLAICEDADFELKPGKGKTIRSNFVHIVGVRRMWAGDGLPKEAEKIPKLDWKTADRAEIEAGLQVSDAVMEQVLRRRVEKGKDPLRYFAYCVAHEANHRGQVEIALRLNGREPSDDVLYGLWDWWKK